MFENIDEFLFCKPLGMILVHVVDRVLVYLKIGYLIHANYSSTYFYPCMFCIQTHVVS